MDDLSQKLIRTILDLEHAKALRKEKKRDIKALRSTHGDTLEAERSLKVLDTGILATKQGRDAIIRQLVLQHRVKNSA